VYTPFASGATENLSQSSSMARILLDAQDILFRSI